MLLELGEEFLGLLIRDTGVNNDIVALLPVDGGGDLVLVTKLQGVDGTEDLVEAAADLGRIGDGETDDLLRVNHEHGTDLWKVTSNGEYSHPSGVRT